MPMGGCPWRFAQRYVLPARKRNVMGPKGVENDALLFLSRGQAAFLAGICGPAHGDAVPRKMPGHATSGPLALLFILPSCCTEK